METQICISGLGCIGLSLAALLCSSGFYVHGVDINKEKVTALKSEEANLQILISEALDKGMLTASTSPKKAAIHLIAVPTLLDAQKKPDLSCIQQAIYALRKYLRSGDLLLIESTCPVGTTEAIAKDLKREFPGLDVAYCPERVLPGNILHELVYNDRVIGGVDKRSTIKAVQFYKHFIRGTIFPTHARTAELVKLSENTYRDINIAFANELSMIAEEVKVDVEEVIQLANRHPRVNILNPGPGVGGYCIPVNPWLLAASVKKGPLLTKSAREVNEKKTEWVIQKIKATIKKKQAKAVACLGLTYKANVADLRGSIALQIVRALEKETKVFLIDPYIAQTDSLYPSLAEAQIVIGLVAHEAFLTIPKSALAGKTLLDFAGLFR